MSWGFLAGAGAGLQSGASSYGRIMDAKRKEDFQLKKDELQFERSKALKDLDFQNQNKRDEKQRGWQEEDIATKRGFDKEDQTYKEGEFDRQQDKKLGVWEAQKETEYNYAMQLAEDKFNLTAKATEAERNKVAIEAEKIFMEDGKLSSIEKLKLASIRTGVDLMDVIKPQGKSLSHEELSTVSTMLEGNEEYQDMLQDNPVEAIAYATRVAETVFDKGRGREKEGVLDTDEAAKILIGQPEAMWNTNLKEIPIDKREEVKQKAVALKEQTKMSGGEKKAESMMEGVGSRQRTPPNAYDLPPDGFTARRTKSY